MPVPSSFSMSQAGRSPLVAPGHDGRDQGALRLYKAFSETDFTEDLKAIEIPTLVLHGEDDHIVPVAAAALLSIKLLRKGTLKSYPGFPHGICATHPG